MKATFILCIATVLIGLTEIAWGHYPEGMTFFAFQWPSGQEPVLDGDLSEWEIVPDTYIVNTEQYTPGAMKHSVFTDVLNMEDMAGWSQFAVVWTSWSSSENALYIAARVFDDDPVESWSGSAVEWGGDQFEVMVDADHSGGIYGKIDWLERPVNESRIKREFWDVFGAQATIYYSKAGVSVPFAAWTAATWVSEPPWFEGVWAYEDHPVPELLTSYERRWIEMLRGVRWEARPGWPEEEALRSAPLEWWDITTYELKIVPFDRIDWRGVDRSIVHTLREREIIGLNYAFTDALPGEGIGDVSSYRVLSGQEIASGWPLEFSASRFSDYLLDRKIFERKVFEEPSVQNTTWGRIKASFNHR